MTGTAKNWLLGCGLTCGAVLFLAVAVLVGGAMWVRGRMAGFEDATDLHQQLEQKYGKAEEFVPWSDGAIPADRMERFLEVREATAQSRQAVAAFFVMLPDSPEEAAKLEAGSFLEQLGTVLRIGRAGVGMAEDLADFFATRNAQLDRVGIGLGEYTYIYVTAYYGALGHSPTEPVEGVRVSAGTPGHRTSASWQAADARGAYLAQLRHLRDSLDENAGGPAAAWAEQLSAEIGALEDDRRRIPWSAGVPEAIRASIEPYRERLEANYTRATSSFELSHPETRGPSIRID